jgi:protein-S-isoprenylcysteine O-methyltransferase Ste14
MTENLNNILAILTIIFWPAIPLFWIPVHLTTNFFRKPGPFSYFLSGTLWIPVAYLLYHQQAFFLAHRVSFPYPVNLFGLILVCTGTILHLWTIRLLGIGIIGIPQVFSRIRNTLVTSGPFAVVRHPTYFAHTLMFSGIFFLTGVYAVAIITAIDFVTVNTIIIPLEEIGLTERFGGDYERYRAKVPRRFFPHIICRSQ